MSDKPILMTLERRPIVSAELTKNTRITGEAGEVGVLIPDDQHAFREHANQDRRMILQLPGREPYHMTIDDIYGGLFRVDDKA